MEYDDEDFFDPDDLAELTQTFDALVHEAETGFIMEFMVSEMSARELVKQWLKATLGDKRAQKFCFREYSKIMEHLLKALQEP